MAEKYKVVSLFSGCGGLDLGLHGGFEYLGKTYEALPFQTVLANDINKAATLTFRNWFKDVEVQNRDVVALVDDDRLMGNLRESGVDLVVGGFPCQDFSLAGKRQGLNVRRGNLYKSMVKAVQKLEPKIFIAENVKGLMTWENGLALQTITSDFKDAGYTVDFRLMNAADFGVPQSRRRVIIVGVKDTLGVEMKWPDPTHCDPASAASSSLQPWVDLEQAIGDLEDEHKHSQLPNSGYSKAKLLAGRQGNTVTKANRPAPTMRAEHHGHIEFHYRLDRRLSAREAARIQSFPDKFEFLNSTTDAYRQIGNAVAPVFGWHLGVALREILDAEQ